MLAARSCALSQGSQAAPAPPSRSESRRFSATEDVENLRIGPGVFQEKGHKKVDLRKMSLDLEQLRVKAQTSLGGIDGGWLP